MAISRKSRAGSTQGLDGMSFVPLFPTVTSGNGTMKPNNARPGKEQPDARPSQRRKVGCKQCGFPADLSRHANDGGSLEGSGAGGIVDVIDSTGGSKDDGYGSDQRYRTGAGCPHCFSKNFAL